MDYQNTSPLKPNFFNNPVLQSRWFIIFVIICVLVFFALGIAGDYYFALPKTKACTQEAQICPDGSSVGRTGPNCEFAPCPTAQLIKNEEKFMGTINNIDYQCHVDGVCNIKIDKKNVIVGKGESLIQEPVGQLLKINLDQNKKSDYLGKKAEVFAKKISENSYTIYGKTEYYVKFLDQSQSQYVCPKTGWVNCMPILTEAAKKLCQPEAINWYIANCPGFKGMAQ